MNQKTANAIVMASIIFGCALLLTRVTAQEGVAPAQPAENERFQVSSWSIPALAGGGRYESSSYGAYVIDSQTGDLWIIKGDSKPKKIGAVASK